MLFYPLHRGDRGFAIAPILYLLGIIGVGAGILFSGFSQILRSGQNLETAMIAKSDLQAAATTLAATSWLSSDHTRLCPPIIGSGTPGEPSAECAQAAGTKTVGASFKNATATRLPAGYANAASSGSPIEVGVFAAGAGVKILDPWGHYYMYCRWENAIGSANALMVISAGPSGKLQTTCGDETARGDNLLVVWSTAVTQNRASVWQTVTQGTAVTGVQFGATGTQLNIDAQGDVTIPGKLGVAGTTTLGAGGLAVEGVGDLAGGLVSTSGIFTKGLKVDSFVDDGALSAGSATLGSLSVTDDTSLNGALNVAGATTLQTLGAIGRSSFSGPVTTSNTLEIGTTAAASGKAAPLLTVGKQVSNVFPFSVDQYGDTTMQGSLSASGASLGDLSASGASNLGGGLNVGGAAILGNTLEVKNAAQLDSNLTANGAASFGGTVNIAGATTLSAPLSGTSAYFNGTVTAANFAGTITVGGGGGATLSGTIPIANGGTGESTAAGALTNLFNLAAVLPQMIPGTDLVNKSIGLQQIADTGVVPGAYSAVVVEADGRITAGGMASSLNDGSGDAISLGSASGMVLTVGNSEVGNWTATGLMIGSSAQPIDKLDVYGATAIGTGYAGSIAAPANGLIVQGQVAIGTAAANGALNVNGTTTSSAFVGDGYGITDLNSGAITGVITPAGGGTGTNTVFAPGSVVFVGTSGIYAQDNANFFFNDAAHQLGIGTNVFASTVGVNGNVAIGTYASAASAANGLIVSGKVGLGTSVPANALDVNGAAAIGSYAGFGGPSNGLIVSGKVGIGTNNPLSTLALYSGSGENLLFHGAQNFASGYSVSSTNDAGTSGAPLQIDATTMELNAANVGIGTATIANTVDVDGNASIGFTNTRAPANGLIVSGRVGIGTATPQSMLHIFNGEVQVGSSSLSCATANAGAIRYANSSLYYCDNTNTWQMVDSSGGADSGDYMTATQTTSPTAGQGVYGGSAIYGALISGSGSTSDVTLENKGGTPALELLTGSTNIIMSGALAIGTASPGGYSLDVNGNAAATEFFGSGAGLTNIGTSNLTTITGTPSATTFLAGNGTWSPVVTSISGAGTGLTPSTSTTGAITLAGTLNVASGGTGLATLTSNSLYKGNGTNALAASSISDNGTNVTTAEAVGIGTTDPLTYQLDVNGAATATEFFGSGAGLTAIGIANLTAITGTPSASSFLAGNGTWQGVSVALGSSAQISGVLPVQNGGTGLSSIAAGDLPYGSTANAISLLAPGANGNVLMLVGGLPGWSPVVTAFSAGGTGLTPSTSTIGAITLAGTLNVASGGTGLTTLTSNTVYKGNGTSALAASSIIDDGSTVTTMDAVGIGTDNPLSYQLNVNGNASATEFFGSGAGLTSIGTSNLTAITGTPSAATFLAGNGTWTSVSGAGGAMGTGAANYLAMWLNGTTIGTSAIYQNAGSVAIGTTATSGALNVNGTATATLFSGSGASLTSIGTSNLTAITGTPSAATFLAGNGTWTSVSGAGGAMGTGAANYLAMWLNGTTIGTSAIYQNAGSVAIGTTATSGALNVNGTATATLFSGSGASLTSIGTSNLTAVTGTPSSTTFLAGNGTWAAISAVASGVTGGTANYLPLWTSATTLGTSTIYQSGGNVGIGTTSPGAKLAVLTPDTGTGTAGLGASWAGYSIFGPNAGSATGAAIGLGYSTTDDIANIAAVAPSTAWKPLRLMSNGLIIDAVGGGEAMRVTSGGFVGIGTATPVAQLEVRAGTNEELVVLGPTGLSSGITLNTINDAANTAEPMELAASQFYLTGGNVGIGTASPANALDVNGGEAIGTYAGTAAGSGNLIVSGGIGIGSASLVMPLTMNVTGSNPSYFSLSQNSSPVFTLTRISGSSNYNQISSYYGDLAFFTSSGSGPGSEKLRLSSAGNVGIGTSTIANKLDVNGAASIGYINTASPSSGLIVSGNVGIGTAAPNALLHINGTAQLGTVNTTAGVLNIYGSSSGYDVIGTAAAGAGILFQLPSSNGGANYVLQTDGSGHTSWVSAALPALASTDVWVGNGSNVATATATTGTGNVVLSASPILTGTITAAAATLSGTLTDSSGTVELTGSSNTIYFGTNGTAVPGSGSIGEKIQLYGTAGSVGAGDYALGISASTFWFNSGAAYQWYSAGSSVATLSSAGQLATINTIQGTQLISTIATGTAPFVVSSTTQVANLNAATLGGANFAAPGAIGGTTPGSGAFTTMSASSTVSGTGFSTYLASPPAIGGTTAAAGSFTTLHTSGTVTLSALTAAGVVTTSAAGLLSSNALVPTADLGSGTASATTFLAGNQTWAVPTPTFTGLSSGDFCTASGTTSVICSTGSTGTGSVVLSASPTLTGTITAAAANFSSDVGIGTTVPNAPLDIEASGSNTQLQLGRLSSFVGHANLYSNSVETLGIQSSSGTEQFSITAGGPIGISTTAPGSLLDAHGGAISAETNATDYTQLWADNALIWGSGAYSGGLRMGNASNLNAGGFNEIMRVGYNGNVGIGTTSPAPPVGATNGATLQVYGNDATIRLTDTTVSNADWALFAQSFNTTKLFRIYDVSAATDRLDINSSGNVGIGTASPANPLTVWGSSTGNVIGSIVNTGTGASAASLLLLGNNTSQTTAGALFENSSGATGYGGGNSLNLYNFISGGAISIGTSGAVPSIYVAGSSGLVVIGGTTPLGALTEYWNNTTLQGFVMQATTGTYNGNPILFENSSAALSGYIAQTASSVAYNTTSDRRLKENIVPTARGLDTLLRIPVDDFNFIADPKKARVQGFVAQDLYKFYPEAVTVGGDDPKKKPWAVDYGRVTPLLVKAIQELKADNDDLRAANDNQAAELATLRARVDALEAAHH
jgi:trimeric autotransporter adhesin